MSAPRYIFMTKRYVITIQKKVLWTGLLGGAGIAALAWLDPLHLRCGSLRAGHFVAQVRKCYSTGPVSPLQCVNLHDNVQLIGVACSGCGKVLRAERERHTEGITYWDHLDGKPIWISYEKAKDKYLI